MKHLAPLALLLLLLASAAHAGAHRASPRVFVNGVPLRELAIVHNGTTYVPLRAVGEALHCEVRYDPKTGVQIWSSLNPLPTDSGAPVVPDPCPHVSAPHASDERGER